MQIELARLNALIDITVSCSSPASTSAERDITGAMKEINNSAQCFEAATAHSFECFAAFSFFSLPLNQTKAAIPAKMTGINLQQCISLWNLSTMPSGFTDGNAALCAAAGGSNWMGHPGRCSCVSLKQNQIQSEEVTHAGGC